MKLYLSSYRVPNLDELFGLFESQPSQLRGGIITNAKDSREPDERETKIGSLEKYLAGIGLGQTSRIDLRTYHIANIESALSSFDYLFVLGGNTYDLRNAMTSSGFDTGVRSLLQGGMVYIGESAGAIVAGPSLRGFESIDSAEGRDEVDRNGLGLIDSVIVPHNDSPDPRYANRGRQIQAANPDHNVQPLNDSEAVVVNGGSIRLVSGTS